MQRIIGWVVGGCLFAASAYAEERLAESQAPTGKFLNATEVKPILSMTKSSWIAVREWQGQDLLYFTQILSWRCGVLEIRYRVNDGPLMLWPVPACDPETYQVGTIPTEATLYAEFELGQLKVIDVELLFDDLSIDQARFERASVLLPGG